MPLSKSGGMGIIMYQSLETICNEAQTSGNSFWKLVQLDDMREQDITEEASLLSMETAYQAMKDSDTGYDPGLRSQSGLVGTDAAKLHQRREEGRMICGDLIASVMERALRIAESNACMKRIVAAPTAGSCGVLPAVLLSVQKKYSFTDKQMAESLYVAGGIGGVIANRAFLAGAEGGCQAEIGSASAMAAGALVSLLGGTPEEICHASALALKNLLGLACDPVAGLVEVPCVKRNVVGAVNAVTSADMALAGICSRIPPDEVIDAMRSIGRHMDTSLRETGTGGLAATPTGLKIREELASHSDVPENP